MQQYYSWLYEQEPEGGLTSHRLGVYVQRWNQWAIGGLCWRTSEACRVSRHGENLTFEHHAELALLEPKEQSKNDTTLA